MNNKFELIYADPPWTYNDKANAGNRGAGYKYDLMTMEDIKNLPIQNIASDNCFLFMWATGPLMPECVDVVKKWGFQYKTISFNWIKTYPKQTDKLFMGMGNYSRTNAEYVLLGIKGKPKRVSKSVHSVFLDNEEWLAEDFVSPILKPHSRKPDGIRKRIVELCGDISRVELFATEDKKLDGWLSTGYDVDGVDIRDFLKG